VPLEVVAIEEDGDERNQQEEEVVRGSVEVRRVPLYRELYQASARKRDAKLKTLEFEVRLAYEGRLGLKRPAESLPQITSKEVWHSRTFSPVVLFCDEHTVWNKVVVPTY
jgi:sentrin-specific protease 1